MQFLFDHTVSVLVGAVVILLVGAAFTHQQRVNVEATLFYSAKQQQLAFVDMVERDFARVGEGVPVAVPIVLNWTDDRFRFRRALDDGAVVTMEYRREQAPGSTEDAPRYRVVRYVEGVSTGQSTDALTEFRVVLRDYDGTLITTNLEDARAIDVRVEAAVAETSTGPVRRLAWASTFRPRSLALLDL